ncbi:hypothetical protein AAC387_Pa02g1736 [Persea americana]
MFAKIQKAGVGAVLIDEVGNVIMAMSKLESGVDSANYIEAITALRALQMVLYIGVSSIILGGDSMSVVEALKSSSTNMSRQGPLFEEIKWLLNHFIKFEVYHVGREGNTNISRQGPLFEEIKGSLNHFIKFEMWEEREMQLLMF